MAQNHDVSPEIDLTPEEKKRLIEIAREAVKSHVLNKPSEKLDLTKLPENLKKERGIFVTLKRGKQLRGCIGHILPMGPLYREAGDVAVTSATEDPRFPEVSAAEIDQLHFEITILSPMRQVSDPSEVVPGKHGLMIRSGFYQGLLLPQVAAEYNWTREEFLSHTCLKAGLPPNAWTKEGTEILVFTADYFEEGEG